MAIKQALGILLILISISIDQQAIVAYPIQNEIGTRETFVEQKEKKENRTNRNGNLKTRVKFGHKKGNIASMENGKIIYGPVKDTAASNTTTWHTEGFIVKSKKTYGDPTKGKRGEFWIKDGEGESVTEGGITSTIFTFPENKVTKQLQNAGINAETLKESGGYVYLNAIIQVYENGKPTGEYYRTLE